MGYHGPSDFKSKAPDVTERKALGNGGLEEPTKTGVYF